MKYQIAERFKSIQGEGVYAGTPMAFIRFVGCSVGKKICHHCDTVFEQTLPWQGGGEFTKNELHDWAWPYEHICFTGGEPLDSLHPELMPNVLLNDDLDARINPTYHIETSGTKELRALIGNAGVMSGLARDRLWICVSPKPGWLESTIKDADEVKVIVPGLGTEGSLMSLVGQLKQGAAGAHPLADRHNFRWPTPQDALRWAEQGKIVFLQPRNDKFDVDYNNLRYVQDFITLHPNLRLSVQLHKILKVQ